MRGCGRPFRAPARKRLGVRLVMLLSAAMLPLGLLALLASLESRRTDARLAERALLAATADTEAGRRALVESALATARRLAEPALARRDDPDACAALLVAAARRSAIFGALGLFDGDGALRCATPDAPPDIFGHDLVRRLRQDGGAEALVVRAPREGAGTPDGSAAVVVGWPVREGAALRGVLAVALPLAAPAWTRWDRPGPAPVRPILFNRLGEALSPPDAAGLRPEGRPLADLARDGGAQVFRGRTVAGERAVFALAPLVPRQLYVLGVWDTAAGPAARLAADHRPLLFTLAMWLASIGVVYFAIYYLAIRHLHALNRQMRGFALGDRSPPPALPPRVPSELREVQTTFRAMARRIARDEAEREAVLRERTVLLREVHHRVKNNLQLIASILNLQMRRLREPVTRQVLQSVRDRVIGIATIHRSLYRSQRLSALRADRLIDDLLRHLFAAGPGTVPGAARRARLQADLAPVTLPADQLVPLALMVTEAVTNALKHLGAPGGAGRGWVRVRLAAEDATVMLGVANSLAPTAAARTPGPDAPHRDAQGPGLGCELMAAFAAQLGGEIRQGRRDDAGPPCWEVCLRFPRETRGARFPRETRGAGPGARPGPAPV